VPGDDHTPGNVPARRNGPVPRAHGSPHCPDAGSGRTVGPIVQRSPLGPGSGDELAVVAASCGQVLGIAMRLGEVAPARFAVCPVALKAPSVLVWQGGR